MNSKNSKTFDSHRLITKSYRWNKLLLSIYSTWKNIKKSYENSKFKILASAWNEEFELPDGSYSVSDIQDHCEYIFENHGEKTVNPSIRI